MALENNNISEEGMVDIIIALSMHPHLESLELNGNTLSKNVCVALATLIQSSATDLSHIYLSETEINDDS